MRRLALFTVLGLLAACDNLPRLSDLGTEKKLVDPDHLPPLSGREQALLLSARGAEAQGNTEAAERDYLSAVEASEGHIEAHLALAETYARQHRQQDERDILVRAKELQPHHALVNYRLGKLELAGDDVRSGLVYFQNGLVSAPNNLDLLSAAGVASDMLGAHGQAQRYYTRAVAQNPTADLSGVRTNLGMSYLLAGDAKKAAEVLKPEAKKPGASPTTKHNLALAYGVLGRSAEAKTLVHGEMDEETRQLAVARLKEYWTDRSPLKNPLAPKVHPQVGGQPEPIEAE